MALHKVSLRADRSQRTLRHSSNSTAFMDTGDQYAALRKKSQQASRLNGYRQRHGARPSSPAVSTTSASSSVPDFQSIQDLVQTVLDTPIVALDQVFPVRGHLHRLWTLKLSNGDDLILKKSPSGRTRRLRYEQEMVEGEARVLRIVSNDTSIAVPELLTHSAGNHLVNGPFNLTRVLPGKTLLSISPSLKSLDRRRLDASLGSHLRALCSLTARSFGSTERVFANTGYRTWPEAFAWLLEAVMRDAEEMLLILPYDAIRYHIKCHRRVLEDVSTPSLVRLNAADESKVLIDPLSLQVVGVLDWGDVIWGDPLASDIFSTSPSHEFLEGFGMSSVTSRSARTRILIYAMYHAIVSIVKQAYRPTPGICDIEARRRLTAAIVEISTMSMN